jgi:hypothetical protein
MNESRIQKLERLIDAALRHGSSTFDASAYERDVVQNVANTYSQRGWDVRLNEGNVLSFAEKNKRVLLKG